MEAVMDHLLVSVIMGMIGGYIIILTTKVVALLWIGKFPLRFGLISLGGASIVGVSAIISVLYLGWDPRPMALAMLTTNLSGAGFLFLACYEI